MSSYADEKITVANSPIGFTPGKLNLSGNTPISATFVVETAEIRYLMDGTDPTSALGTLGLIGVPVTINGESNIRKFRAIRTGAVSATIHPQYFDGNG